MHLFLYVLGYTAYYFLYVMELAMFIRAVFSWIDPARDSKVHQFLYNITEPVIMPVRSLVTRFNLFSDLPIDVSFSITFLLLIVVQRIIRLVI